MRKALTRTQWWIVALFPPQLALTAWVTLNWGTAHGLAAAAMVFIPVSLRLWMLNKAASHQESQPQAEGVVESYAD